MKSKADNSDIELYIEQEINLYLSELPMEEQVQMGIASFQARIPYFNEAQKNAFINGIVNFVSLELQAKHEEVYRNNLLYRFSKLGLDGSRPVNELKQLIWDKLAAMDAQQLWDEGFVFRAIEEDLPAIKRSIVVIGIRRKLLRIAAKLDTNSVLEANLGHVVRRIRESYVPDKSWRAAMGAPLLNWHKN